MTERVPEVQESARGCLRHPIGSWRTRNGGCYVCWCEQRLESALLLLAKIQTDLSVPLAHHEEFVRRNFALIDELDTFLRGGNGDEATTFLCKHCEGTGALTDGITECPRCYGRGATA